MKRFLSLTILIIHFTLILTGCNRLPNTGYSKYTYDFFGTFDTVIQVVGYAHNEEEFNSYMKPLQAKFEILHKLYDIYNNYEGINNAKTINDSAGISPVKVDKELIDIIQFSKQWYEKTDGVVNVAMGSVLSIWHKYRTEGIDNPEIARLPDADELANAAQHTDINNIIVDTVNSTVFLTDTKMSLDLGAVAKGYATEIVANEMQGLGFISGIISSGGNVKTFGKPQDGIREKWSIGIQDPDTNALIPDEEVLDTVFVRDLSVVSSGDYQRYYVVGDKRISHIIDPGTLMPANYYRAVTIVCKDSGIADFLSTTLFILPIDKGKQLIQNLSDVECLWIMPDESIEATDGMKKIMKKMGGATEK